MRYFKKNSDGFTLKRHIVRIFDTTTRTAIIMLFAAPFAGAALAFWYYGLYQHGIRFMPEAENITVAAWVPFFGFPFIFVLTPLLTDAWKKDDELNDAINTYDFEAFMRLRIKHLHPLAYAMLYLVAAMTLGAFMLVPYPDAWSGLVMVGSVAYLVSFAPFALTEIDKPLSGIWFIKNVPPEWMEINPRPWLRKSREDRRKELLVKIQETGNANGAVEEK